MRDCRSKRGLIFALSVGRIVFFKRPQIQFFHLAKFSVFL